MLKYFFLSTVSGFLDYRYLLPRLFDGFRHSVRFLKKDDVFNWAGISWEVLWPDLKNQVFIEKVLEKVAPLEERFTQVGDIIEKYGFNEILERVVITITSILEAENEEQTNELYQQLSAILRQMERELETEDEKVRVREVLQGSERGFRELANWLSLVIRSDNNDFLFLGDAEKEALDQINPKRFGSFIAVKASHHGTKFASSLVGLETDFLLVSRDGHLTPINQGYFSIKTKRNLITKFDGDCVLNLL
jgi:hypothetical protein